MTLTETERPTNATSLHDYVTVIRRRKWIVIPTTVAVAVLVTLLSLQQQKLFRAEAEVLLSRQNLAAMLTNTQDPSINVQAERFAETQAQLAEVPIVAERVLEATGVPDMDTTELLEQSSVSPKQNADLLLFSVDAPTPAAARQLATAYAKEYTEYRRELDTAALTTARAEVHSRIEELRRSGDSGTSLAVSLERNDQQLSTLQTLQTANSSLVRQADQADQVQPRPVRSAVLGLFLGLLIGVGAAFIRDALDTRVRTGEELSEALGLPLLGFLPPPPRRLEREDKLVMLADPHGLEAEAFRSLRVSTHFARLDRVVRTILVTSAVQGEGKSVTAGNLAIALARAGEHVVLVDLDLRRPSIAKRFALAGSGVTDVALGETELDDALRPIDLDAGEAVSDHIGDNARTKAMAPAGRLEVLTAGQRVVAPGEFLETQRLGDILATLSGRATTVLVDSPPILQVGDALSLSTQVDGVLFFARLDLLRRSMVPELERMLAASPAAKLGLVVASPRHGTSRAGYYGYGYVSTEPAASPEPLALGPSQARQN